MPLRLIINDQPFIDDVSGMEQLEQNYFFQKEIFTYLNEITGSVTLTGAAYRYLRDLMFENICEDVVVKVEDDSCGAYQVVYEGVVYVTDIKWNITKCEASMSISDAGIVGLIDDNKSVPVNLVIPYLKNGGQTNNIQQVQDVGFVNINNTQQTATGRNGVNLFHAMQRVVEVISDNEISVRSDYFDPAINNQGHLQTPQKWCVLMTGKELRLGNHVSFPILEYRELMRDVNSLFNISVAFEIDESTFEKYLRIEPKAYFNQKDEIGYRYEDVDDIEQSTEEDLFYAVMEFGSFEPSEHKSDPAHQFLEQTSFLSHDHQKYHLGGQCNIDNSLDLRCEKLVYDTNAFFAVLGDEFGTPVPNADQWDDEVFIIHYTSLGGSPFTFYAVRDLIPYAPTYPLTWGYYNAIFSPYQTSLRWFGNIPFSIFSYLGGTGSYDAAAYGYNIQPTYQTGIYPPALGRQWQYINFPFETSDPANALHFSPVSNPDPSNTGSISHYIAPAGGMYEVSVDFCFTGYLEYLAIWVIDPSNAIQYYIFPYNSDEGVNPLNPYGAWSIGNLRQVTNECVSVSTVIPVQAGNRIFITLPYAMGQISQASLSIRSTFSGQFQQYDFSATKYLRSKFEFDIPLSDCNQILSAPHLHQQALFNGGVVVGYLDNFKRNFETGKTSIELLGSS
jgi:hypothetical protein